MSDRSRRGLFGRLLGRAEEPPAKPPARAAPPRPARPGVFTVAEHLCLAWQGTSCSTCRERCPEPGAISVSAGRPTIDPAVCTGCGECVASCPAPILATPYGLTQPPLRPGRAIPAPGTDNELLTTSE